MKILLDECIPRKLKYSLPDHECHTLPEAGLAGRKNGFLLDLAEKAGFEIFVTMDKGLEYQQNLEGRSIAILILRGKSKSACGSPSIGSRPPENHEAGAKGRDSPHRWRRAGVLILGTFKSNGRPLRRPREQAASAPNDFVTGTSRE
jgi:predicted nuclease of predicted toxin-antitoxin system